MKCRMHARQCKLTRELPVCPTPTIADTVYNLIEERKKSQDSPTMRPMAKYYSWNAGFYHQILPAVGPDS